MNILHTIASSIKGAGCEKLVKKTGNEISLSGSSILTGGFKMDVGSFSNRIKELVSVPDTAVSLDDTQYLLCTAISHLKDSPQLREKCIAIRLQLIIGFNQLRTILAAIKEEPTEDMKKELVKWLRYMNGLNMHSISLLDPESASKGKSGLTLTQIMEYQGIDQNQLHEAVNFIV
jgi:hypothetical protein